MARAISDERGAKPEVIVLEESTCDDENFWKLLGGKGRGKKQKIFCLFKITFGLIRTNFTSGKC